MKGKQTEAPIVVENLHKAFGEQHVLNGLNLRVDQGSTTAVLGRSGTGKSVLLKLLIGLQPPDEGSICVHGEDITRLEPRKLNEVRKRVGFLFQQAALYDSMTVAENVEFPLNRHSDLSHEDRKKKARELLHAVGMDKDVDKMPSEISGGMQKRVGLARALALDPDILLFDEPTSALDPITAREIEDLILKLQKERHVTSLVVTHDIRGARHYANRMAFVDNGVIAGIGTLEELRASRHPFVTEFLRE